MFSYRHAFHAGNHGDVLKHVTLLAVLRHLMRKPGPLLLVDTHAGAGRYRLDGRQALKSAEAAAGVLRLQGGGHGAGAALPRMPAAHILQDYLALLQRFNDPAADAWTVYPGSPAIMHALMSEPGRAGVADRLHLFEWHPTVHELLARQLASWPDARRVLLRRADGFAGLRGELPPPRAASQPRRAFVLIDPPYEVKTDYDAVSRATADALARCATGVYMIWHPVVAQPGAVALPRRLQSLAGRADRAWLYATLDVGRTTAPRAGADVRPGMAASGVFVINPPYTLAEGLRAALPWLAQALTRGNAERWQVEQHGA